MIRFEQWQPRIPLGTAWLRLLDQMDERVLGHRFYRFCKWLAEHPAWRPTSAAHPRPGGRPYYIAANCQTCETPLVLDDRLHDSTLQDKQVWHDEWVCPTCRDGIWMDWPVSERQQLGFSKR